MACFRMGSTRHHVAPCTEGPTHVHRKGNCRGSPHLAGRPVLPLAQTPGKSPSGPRGGGTKPCGDPQAAARQNGTPHPANRHSPGRPTGLRVEVVREGHTTAAKPSGPPALVLAHGYPGQYHPGCQGDFATTQSPDALLCSLQAGAALVLWRENGRPGPHFPLVQGQALLHAQGMGTVEVGRG